MKKNNVTPHPHQASIEESFQVMLNNNPTKICLDAIEYILSEFKKEGIDTLPMNRMVQKKMRYVQEIVPYPGLLKKMGVQNQHA